MGRCQRFVWNVAAGVSLLAWGLSEGGEDRRAAAVLTQECFVVDGEKLKDLVVRINQYNSRQLVIVDRAIRRFRVSGRVCPTRLDAFIHGLHHLGIAASGAEL